ncbi:hypothetical protein ES288_D02G036800v1 [Gossypium darwinii]|uniref:Uncharacterized protein n=2 Tax=Gossypium TaxID=3633 RepID=A0A5D2LST1_GOSTO|nr:hypothetical protein ES288_D02G036800v1 [Gossypium darwinii]TYH82106.1 hypothetical protein ES332_D02G034700v1 [Gossypium tomentosum]TYH82111.1 hypothetical protein ES332_D02G035200v1 [Gossypium tomentosum]
MLQVWCVAGFWLVFSSVSVFFKFWLCLCLLVFFVALLPLIQMSILSWNIRGIGAKIKYKVVRLAVVLNKLDTNCLHGSKMVSVKDQKIRSLWPYDVFGFSFSPSIGRSRGLLVVWDIDSLSVGSKIYMLRVL